MNAHRHLISGVVAFLTFAAWLVPATAAEKTIFPPPTAAELAAPPGPKAGPMELRDAKIAMGWLPILASRPLGGMSDQKIGIVDLGFHGLREWLDAHPDEKKRTTYVGDLAAEPATDTAHGYEVYRVARAVLADAQLILYKVRGAGDILRAIGDASRRGVVIINASVGWLMPDVAEVDEYNVGGKKISFGQLLDAVVRESETFVFFAAGNERRQTHTWQSSESGNDQLVVLRRGASSPEEAKSLRVRLPTGPSTVYFNWDFRGTPTADYELDLAGMDGRVLATARVGKRSGSIVLNYRAAAAINARIRIHRLAGPRQGVLMRLLAAPGIAVGPGFNGLQTAFPYSFVESPFIVYVGGVGKTAAGTLAPSAFSDIGRKPDGALLPHVLGPGQLMLDGKEIDGTSFAAPFVTAVYGATFGFNFKNLMERTATMARLDPSVPPFARARWGVPAVMQKLFTPQGQINVTGPTKVEDVRHHVAGDSLVVDFRISRCCMEGLTWYAGARLFDAKSGKFVTDASGKTPLVGAATLHSDKRDYVREPVEIRFPMKQLAAYKGHPLELKFAIGVRTWEHAAVRGYAASKIKVDEAPRVEIVP